MFCYSTIKYKDFCIIKKEFLILNIAIFFLYQTTLTNFWYQQLIYKYNCNQILDIKISFMNDTSTCIKKSFSDINMIKLESIFSDINLIISIMSYTYRYISTKELNVCSVIIAAAKKACPKIFLMFFSKFI